MIRRYLLLALFICLSFAARLMAQNPNLAQHYYTNGEYEKAAELYYELSESKSNNQYYFDQYIACLLNVNKQDEAEAAVRRQLKKHPDQYGLYVTLGRLEEEKGDMDAADKQYQSAINKLTPDRMAIQQLANAFTSKTKYDLAIQTYLKGQTLLKDESDFSYNLADIYMRQGETVPMITAYLDALDVHENLINNIQSRLSRNLSNDENYTELKTQLYERIQDYPNKIVYPEMLTWVFTQEKDFKNAFRQMKALDQKLDENGRRIYDLAEVAANEGDYQTAIDGFRYITEHKGKTTPYYHAAQQMELITLRKKILSSPIPDTTAINSLLSQYDDYLATNGRQAQNANIMSEYAQIEAFQLNNLPKAIDLLNELIALPGLDKNTKAQAKLDLGDLYLMDEDVWEATLLYSQVDKDFKEDLIGEEARFRNARLSYFNADFQWAQAQFDVLKASTSKLIANDALDFSIFIMDNLGLDTTPEPLRLYAEAELKVFQNQFDQGFLKLDTLIEKYPEHSLDDDIYYLKGNIYKEQHNWENAIYFYERIVEKYPDEIRADNALYALGDIYETYLNEPDKAKAYFEKLFLEYPGSTLAVMARKRYRALRGDEI